MTAMVWAWGGDGVGRWCEAMVWGDGVGRWCEAMVWGDGVSLPWVLPSNRELPA